MAARQRDPSDALGVYVEAARAVTRSGDFVDFSERGRFRVRLGWIKANDVAGIGERGAPHRAVVSRRRAVERHVDAAVLGRVERLVRVGVLVTLAVAVG